ncbi:1925_t:CDS:2 [Paraglomus brasilianum]|uniref:1925_t:CDS:1 n=1 Tax=Paraglomus brasilianum TaxID=144538 RepID=A0A9N9ASY2_9GLOM|nr:1925_t:CDS:2 [Paraglomus brasilianum]
MPLAPDAIAYYALHIIAIPLSLFTFIIYRRNTNYSIIAYYSLTTIVFALITSPIAFISDGKGANAELCTFQGMMVSYCLVAIGTWISSIMFTMWWLIFKGEEIETPTWFWLGIWLIPILGTTVASVVAARSGGIESWNYFCMISEPLVATSLGVFLAISLSGLGASVLSGTRMIQIISSGDLPTYSAYPDFLTCLFPYISFFTFGTTAEARRYWTPRWLSNPCVDRANNVLDQFSIVYPPKKPSVLSERGRNEKNSRNEELSSIYTENYTGEPSHMMVEQRNSQHSGFLQVAPLTHDPSSNRQSHVISVKGKKRASDAFRASVHQFLRASITSVNQLGSRISPQIIPYQQQEDDPTTKSDINQNVNITIDDPERLSFGNWQAGGAPLRTSRNRDSFPVYPSAQHNYPMARTDETERKERKSRNRNRIFSTPMISSSARITSSSRTASFSYPPKKTSRRDSISDDLRFLKAFSFELRKGKRILDFPEEYIIKSDTQSIASLSLREIEKDDNLQSSSSSSLPSPTYNERGQKVFDKRCLRITNQLDVELEVTAPSDEIPYLSVPRPPQLIIPPPPSPSKLKPAHLSQPISFSFLNNSPFESSSDVQDYPTRDYYTQAEDSRRYTRATTASSASTRSRDSFERTSPNGLRLTPRASMPVYTLNLPPLPNSQRNSWENGRKRESLGSIPSGVP